MANHLKLKQTFTSIKPFLILAMVLCFANNLFYGQTLPEKIKKYNQKDIEKYSVHNNIYNFWWYKHKSSELIENDTLPYFVDERHYKGIINYGVEFSASDRRNFYYSENFIMHKLHITISSCFYNPKDSIISLEGFVTGGPESNSLVGGENNVNVFIGQVKDTVNALFFRHLPGLNPDEIIATYKGEKIKKFVILDTFPSLYIKKYQHYSTNSGDVKTFKIMGKVEKNSSIVFASMNCFTEIFDIGSLVFSNNKSDLSSKLRSKANDDLEFKVIIKDNVQISNKDNLVVPETLSYFKITKQAEDCILIRQYGKAKTLYDNLLTEHNYMFARDMHNAVRCAIFARDYNRVVFWCKKLALKGVPLIYFDAKIFDAVKKQPQWQDFLDAYSNLNKAHKEGLNKTLIKRITDLIETDQKVYVKNSIEPVDGTILAETTEFVDDEFIKLIKKEGYPTEEQIGVRMAADSMTIITPKYFVLIAHSHQTKSKRLSEIKALRNEAANKLEYDAFRDNLDVIKKNGNTCFHIYKGNLYNNTTCLTLNKMQLQKIKFRFNNQHNFIIDAGAFSVIPYEIKQEKEDEKFFEERFDFVMKLTDDWFFYEN